ncbi:MAG: type II toxin-antitoxin system RelE/ParE family toxin [Nitrospinota bacterium]|nr:type II toxin-antitoxin system RelE/ParE family toxin [Nitrospinota bacterium]
MKYLFHPEAEAEFRQAVEYYEKCEEGLGRDFALEVYSTIQLVMLYPKAWPVVAEHLRRSLVRRFPYGIIYSEDGEEIFILAVMDLHREPGYWVSRV